MTLKLGALVLAGAVGIWAGFSAWPSALTGLAKVWAVLSAASGGLALLSAWIWWRAQPGSGDALVAPMLALMNLGLLIMVVPAALWPQTDAVRAVAAVAAAIFMIAAVVAQRRTLRLLRQQGNAR